MRNKALVLERSTCCPFSEDVFTILFLFLLLFANFPFLPSFPPPCIMPFFPFLYSEKRRRRKKANKKLPLFPLPFFAATHYVEWRRLGIIGSWCVVFVHVVFLFFHLLPFFGLNNQFVVSFLSSRRERFFKSL